MRLSWTDEFQRAPFASEYLSYGPAAWQGQALVVDSARNIYLVDPATGSAVKRGTVPGKGVPLGAPVAAGDLLLLAEGTTLHATRLTDGGNAWEFNAQEIGYLPAAVERNMVLWVTQSAVDSLHNPGTLHALDRATGALRWEVSVSGLGAMGGMAVRDGVAYLSTPPSAYDVATGKLLWEADVRGISYGGVALNAAGDTLFVAAVSANLSDGLIVALDSSNGNERWRQALKGEYLDLLFESVLLDGQTLVVPLATHALVGLDAANGTQRWRYAPPQPLAGRVTVGEGHVFLSLQNGHVVALDTPSGTVAGVSRDFETNLNSLQARPRALLLAGRLIVPLTSRLIGYTLER